MKNCTEHAAGFILPLMLILLLILSLLWITLYQVTESHLLVFQAVRFNLQTEQSLVAFKQSALNAARQAHRTVPDPSNSPDNDRLYLRSINAQTSQHLWQEKSGSFRILIACDPLKKCQILSLHRLL